MAIKSPNQTSNFQQKNLKPVLEVPKNLCTLAFAYLSLMQFLKLNGSRKGDSRNDHLEIS